MSKRIFVTGASGCIGHYLADLLIQKTDHELFFLVRNPAKLKFDYNSRPGVTIIQGDLREIERVGRLLKTIDHAVLTATAWGGAEETYDTNVTKTIRLLNLLDPAVCQQVIYFSTASILDRHHQPLKQAGEIGTDYIQSKFQCHEQLGKLAIAPHVITLFPTLVFGGDAQKPYSHISAGIKDIVKLVPLIRFFRAEGSFHFLHAQDIAQVVSYLIEHPIQKDEPHELVLGNPPLTVNQTIEEICAYLKQRIYFRIPLSLQLADVFIKLFRVQMAEWDRFCLSDPHFTYQHPISPASFGLANYCTSVSDLLRVSGISQKM
ncbi:MAG: NAD(P)-dependent oxidoreductase [Drouetiella hepatica Uher 2000/2452]|jgi:nucleoside-diphosphate-sugar epimerase|uniref:NAD(P)-dependent oxidoreductase n=1 Tax=Drouetiella hepatica Uher 2000/2452 TaxID=904376 RepID=A0A951QCU1_9CYAN|nr:NAD(P)-dependent oxidoreductase [Drouetiella hepatica Uher 2000/2452]